VKRRHSVSGNENAKAIAVTTRNMKIKVGENNLIGLEGAIRIENAKKGVFCSREKRPRRKRGAGTQGGAKAVLRGLTALPTEEKEKLKTSKDTRNGD